MGLPARDEIAAVLDAAQKPHKTAGMIWNIETINLTCVGWKRALTDSALGMCDQYACTLRTARCDYLSDATISDMMQ